MVIYRDDDVIGTLVESVPLWEMELDVCGRARRYHAKDAATFVEVTPRCTSGACVAAPACRNVTLGSSWTVEAHEPTRCSGARIDPSLDVEVDRGGLTVVAEGHEVGRTCDQPSLMVAVDGAWFSLCGGKVRPGSRYPTGLVLSPGPHALEVVAIEPRAYDFPPVRGPYGFEVESLDVPCTSSRRLDVIVPEPGDERPTPPML